MFFAHSGLSDDTSEWQLLADHLSGVSRRASALGAPLGISKAAGLVGLAHDLGKYDPAFQAYLRKNGLSVDHSTAGAKILLDLAPTDRITSEALAYCILGHHAGLPDRSNGTAACLDVRVENFDERRLDAAWRRDIACELGGIRAELRAHVAMPTLGFDLTVAVRMLFSCLVEADYLDTEAFYAGLERREVDRDWPALCDRLPGLRAAFDAHMAGFGGEGELDALRRDILAHVRGEAVRAPGLFTLTVPTGGGKTLASLGFALDHAAVHRHRRIIYAIPFTSIIDQTAAIFRAVLGPELVLEHHSAIDEERNEERTGRDKLRLAMENWAAPVVVTTNVQLFESLFSARPSRARKLHNIADSVIVLDEAQTLPRGLLRPCLRMLDCLARHWGCSIVLCTATQPAVEQALKGQATLDLRELAPDPQGLARRLRRARIVDGGEMDNAALTAALRGEAQAFVIVNSRKHALDLFREARAEGVAALVHLTTRQTAAHRQEILAAVRRRLKDGEPCRLVATSLIEAGVDLDFRRGWRARAGLDQVIQAAGRVNREGRQPTEASIVTMFTNGTYPVPREIQAVIGDMDRAVRDEDFASLEAIDRFFREVYWRMDDGLDGKRILDRLKVSLGHGTSFAFRSIAEDFRMIESAMVPVVIPRGEAAGLIAQLTIEKIPTGRLARALQRHVVLVPEKARRRLIACGKAAFRAPELRGDQFVVLETMALYHEDSGLWWEDAEYLAVEQIII